MPTMTQSIFFDKVLNHYGISITNGDKIVCPFHGEDTPSLVVDFEKDIYHCFGCDASGDVIDFISRIDNINRLKAAKKLSEISANNSGINKSLMFKKFIETTLTTKEYIELARNEFKKFIKPDWNYEDNYLLKRGFNANILDDFNVRMDIDSDHPIVIPLLENNRFRGFVKRSTGGNTPDKYMYNKGFKRGRFLTGRYGYGIIFVTEGILDYLKAYQYGVRNICCLLGYKASSQHIDILKRYSKELIVALDNDKKGVEGTEFLSQYFKISRFIYPNGVKDICEMQKEQFVVYINKTLAEMEKRKDGKEFV
jgi:DNA primase